MIVTTEPCPTCKTEAQCWHWGKEHVWQCPECGEIVALVGYVCEGCAAGGLGNRPECDGIGNVPSEG